jgi:hypothetical protein
MRGSSAWLRLPGATVLKPTHHRSRWKMALRYWPLDLATTVASGWFDNCPDGLSGEVRMAAFGCTAARTVSASQPNVAG